MYCIQHCFIRRPSDSTVSEDAEIEPRTVATSALAVRHWLDLIHKLGQIQLYRKQVQKLETLNITKQHKILSCSNENKKLNKFLTSFLQVQNPHPPHCERELYHRFADRMGLKTESLPQIISETVLLKRTEYNECFAIFNAAQSMGYIEENTLPANRFIEEFLTQFYVSKQHHKCLGDFAVVLSRNITRFLISRNTTRSWHLYSLM